MARIFILVYVLVMCHTDWLLDLSVCFYVKHWLNTKSCKGALAWMLNTVFPKYDADSRVLHFIRIFLKHVAVIFWAGRHPGGNCGSGKLTRGRRWWRRLPAESPPPPNPIPSSGLFAPVSKVRIRVLRLCGIRATSYNLAFNPTSSPSRISEESLTIFVRNTFAFLRQMTSKSSTSCVWWLTSRVEQSGCEGGWKSSLCTSVGAPWLLSVRPSSPR